MIAENISFYAAFTLGLLSFFTPCVLPLIPAYFTFITGMSLDEMAEGHTEVRKKVIISTIAYVSGFSFVFTLAGAAVSAIGQIAFQYSDYIRIAGGIVILILGLHLTGIFRISKLDFEKRYHFNEKPLHFFGTFLVGMAFAAGWSPCISPMLGSIFAIAAQEGSVTKGTALLAIYSAGLAIPFLLMSVFINYMLVFIKKATKYVRYVNLTTGLLLLVIGVVLLMDKVNYFTTLLL